MTYRSSADEFRRAFTEIGVHEADAIELPTAVAEAYFRVAECIMGHSPTGTWRWPAEAAVRWVKVVDDDSVQVALSQARGAPVLILIPDFSVDLDEEPRAFLVRHERLSDILGECYAFEYLLIDPSGNKVIFETDDALIGICGAPPLP